MSSAEWRKNYVEKNREKLKDYRKKYRQRPEVKDKHRKEQADWRKNNPDKQKECVAKAYLKNKDKWNFERRERRKNDPKYAEKLKEIEAAYKASGRRKEVQQRRQIEKAVELRAKSKEYKKNNPEKVKARFKIYRENVWNKKEKKQRENLENEYVIKVIKQQTGYNVKTTDIPKELIELKKLTILLKRKCKKNDTEATNI